MNEIPFAQPGILLLLLLLPPFGGLLIRQHRRLLVQLQIVGSVGWPQTIIRLQNGRFRQNLFWLAGSLTNVHPDQMAQQGTLLGPAIETASYAFPIPHDGWGRSWNRCAAAGGFSRLLPPILLF